MNSVPQEPEQQVSTNYKLGWGVAIVLILATIFTALTIFTYWANRQALDEDNWRKVSTEMLESPAVRDALASYLVEQLFDNVDVEAEMKAALPEDFKGLSGPATGGLRQLALAGAKRGLEQPIVQQAWETAAVAAHRQAISILEGGNERVSTTDGRVVVNTRLILQDLAEDVGLPSSLVGKIPADAGELEIVQSEDLKTAQRAESAFKGMTWLFFVITILLYSLAIWLARLRRWRAVVWMGVSLMIGAAVALILQSIAREPLIDALATTASVKLAVADVYDISTELLTEMAKGVFFSGALVFIGGLLAGPWNWSRSFRRSLAPFLRDYLPASAGVAALLFLILLWWAPTRAFSTTLGVALNLLLAVAGFVGLVLQTRREFPDAPPADFSVPKAWVIDKWERTRDFVTQQSRTVAARTRDATAGMRNEPTAADEAPTVETKPTAPTAVADDTLAQIERLHELHKSGALTAEEFAAAKSRLLGS